MESTLNLKERTVGAIKWNLIATILSNLSGFISLWVLSKLLEPDAFGVVSAGMLVALFFTTLMDFGISNSLIRGGVPSPKELSSLLCLNIAFGLVVSVAAFFGSGLIALAFNASKALADQIRIASLGFFALSFSLQPKALLAKALRFDTIAKSTMLGALLNLTFIVSLTWLFRSPWCVAVAYVISNGAASAFLVARTARSPFWQGRLSISLVVPHLRYGIQLISDSLVNQVSINAYPLLMSRLVSVAAMGGYTLAYNFSISLFERLNPVISQTLFPALATIGNDDKRLRSAFLKATTFGALINFPLLCGVAILAKPLTETVFDAKWSFISPMIQVLCITGLARSLDTPMISVLLVKGQMYRNVLLGLAKLAIGLPAAWWLGKNYGLMGIVYSFLAIQVASTLCSAGLVMRAAIDLSFANYFTAVLRALLHVLPMAACGTAWLMASSSYPSSIQLIIGGVLCAGSYLMVLRFSPSALTKEFNGLCLQTLSRRVQGK